MYSPLKMRRCLLKTSDPSSQKLPQANCDSSLETMRMWVFKYLKSQQTSVYKLHKTYAGLYIKYMSNKNVSLLLYLIYNNML